MQGNIRRCFFWTDYFCVCFMIANRAQTAENITVSEWLYWLGSPKSQLASNSRVSKATRESWLESHHAGTHLCTRCTTQPYTGITTAPVLLADNCHHKKRAKIMASTAAYNLWDNRRYSIANFNFNLTVIRLQQLNILSRKQTKYCRK